MNRKTKKTWIATPPWLLLGAVLILAPIFLFWTLQNIHKEKENTTRLLLEKGAALIRSFEAGARTGMMGMMGMRGGRGFQLQRLLAETAQQPDIIYLIVTDTNGSILADSDPSRIGDIHGRKLDLESISQSAKVSWRQVSNEKGNSIFEVYRQFSPKSSPGKGHHNRMMSERWGRPVPAEEAREQENFPVKP